MLPARHVTIGQRRERRPPLRQEAPWLNVRHFELRPAGEFFTRTTMIREYITYSPPKGNLWGHTLRYQTVQRAWDSIRVFLDTCTVHEPVRLHTLTAHAVRPWDDQGVARSYSSEVRAAFGPPDSVRPFGMRRPDGEEQTWSDDEWNASDLALDDILSFFASHEPWPKVTNETVSLRASVRFQWRDPSTGERMLHQDHDFGTADGRLQSSLEMTFGRRTHIQSNLNFPFPEGSPRLPAFIDFVQDSFPATLHQKLFRVATPLASGFGYRARKMVISPFTSA